MKWIRATVNAVLVATLVKPMLRWSISRWRRQAAQYAEATIVIPAHELLEAALPPQLVALGASLEPTFDEADDEAEQDTMRTVVLVGAVVAVIAASALVVAAVVRRRRTAAAPAPKVATDPVAVPIEVPAAESAEAESPATPRKGPSMSQESHSVGRAAG